MATPFAVICGWRRPTPNEGEGLSAFCRKFTVPLRQAPAQQRDPDQEGETPNRPVFHAFFLANDHLMLGYSLLLPTTLPFHGDPAPAIPGRCPEPLQPQAGRAFYVFVPKEEWDLRFVLRPEGRGSWCRPGGWTYQLVRRGMMVTAVDNGMMAQSPDGHRSGEAHP